MATTTTIPVPALAAGSAVEFVKLLRSGSLHLRSEHLGKTYIASDGRPYTVFRETTSGAVGLDRTVIEVGFRLGLLRSSRIGHWLFQRASVLTTPFWSGFAGFGTKLWMVDKGSQNYLGIYQWGAEADAHTYLRALTKVLRPLSIRGSVWSRLYAQTELGEFLARRTPQEG